MLLPVLAVIASWPLVITEVMSNPQGTGEAHGPEDRNEFVEIYNAGTQAIDLYDWVVDDGDARDRLVPWQDSSILILSPAVVINYTWLRPGGYAVVLDSEYTDRAPVGGHVQPYRFGDAILILTTRNTTIGNGFALTDPVLLISPYEDTVSTFGTPKDSLDSIPCDPGDGVSWERIAPDRPDTLSNWSPCFDSSGSTPGRANSASSVVDLAVHDIGLDARALLEPGRLVSCSATVTNVGVSAADSWRLRVWLDTDADMLQDPAELLDTLPGSLLAPGDRLVRHTRFTCPRQPTDLWMTIDCPQDRSTTNNQTRLTVMPRTSRLLELELASFSPDADGFEDSLGVLYRLPESGGHLSVRIHNLRGHRVRTLFSGAAPTEQGGLVWDGRDDRGGLLATGIYAVSLEYRYPVTTLEDKLPVVLLRK